MKILDILILLLPFTIASTLEQINQHMPYNLTWEVLIAEGDIITSASKVTSLDPWFSDLQFSGVHLFDCINWGQHFNTLMCALQKIALRENVEVLGSSLCWGKSELKVSCRPAWPAEGCRGREG